MPGRRVIVTGGAGFIGSHVVDAFVALGDEVVVVDNLSTGKRQHVNANARLEEIDIVDAPNLSNVFAEFAPQVVCHLAQASHRVRRATGVRSRRQRARNAERVRRRCAKRRRRGRLRVDRRSALRQQRAAADAGDAAAQTLAVRRVEARRRGVRGDVGRLHRLVVLRLGNIYGPRQNPHGEAGVVAIFSERLLRREKVTLYGHGEPTRDYVHVTDAARAFVVAAERKRPGTYNVGTGRETSVSALLELLQAAAGTTVETKLQPLRPGELERSALDPGLIEQELGWRAAIPVEDGLAETFRAYAAPG